MGELLAILRLTATAAQKSLTGGSVRQQAALERAEGAEAAAETEHTRVQAHLVTLREVHGGYEGLASTVAAASVGAATEATRAATAVEEVEGVVGECTAAAVVSDPTECVSDAATPQQCLDKWIREYPTGDDS